jgi:O-acetyl-ADP-ribose deacetylase (regulator of RNase III)
MHPQPVRLQIIRSDITTLDVEMIVNAANAALCGGGGVDGAIHDAAGPDLLAECRTLGGARPGEVKLTRGYKLKAKFIAHAVGPVWSGGDQGEAALLEACYRGAMKLARENGCRSIAFPSISTGAYRFPIREAAAIAVRALLDELAQSAVPETATLCCFSDADRAAYERALASSG